MWAELMHTGLRGLGIGLAMAGIIVGFGAGLALGMKVVCWVLDEL